MRHSAATPLPWTVRSAPPANDPMAGSMEVMRGGISASNGLLVARSSSRVERKPKYASPRWCGSEMACKLKLKKPPVSPLASSSSLHPTLVASCRF